MTRPLHGISIVLTAAALILTVPFTGCKSNDGSHSVTSGQTIATIDGTAILKSEYDKTANQMMSMYHLEENPTALQNPLIQEAIKRGAMQKLIIMTFLKNEAKKAGITVTPEELKQVKDSKILEFGSPEMFNRFLSENKMTQEDFDARISEEILVNKFIEKQGPQNFKVSDKEAEAFYKSHPTEFVIPESYRASHILVKAMDAEMKRHILETSPNNTSEQTAEALKTQKDALKAKAQNLLAQAQADPSRFAALANKSSDDTVSAKNGGDLGQLTQALTEPGFWAALKKAKPGAVYPELVETPYGYHVLMAKDHVQKHTQSFVEAKASIIAQLSQQKKMAFLDNWASAKLASVKPTDISPEYRPQDPKKAAATTPPAQPKAAPAAPAKAN